MSDREQPSALPALPSPSPRAPWPGSSSRADRLPPGLFRGRRGPLGTWDLGAESQGQGRHEAANFALPQREAVGLALAEAVMSWDQCGTSAALYGCHLPEAERLTGGVVQPGEC